MKRKLLILGAGGHGRQCASVAKKMGDWHEIRFLDDTSSEQDVIGKTSEFTTYISDYELFIGIGSNKIREKKSKQLRANNANIATLIHPSAIIDDNSTIEEGAIIMPGAIINNNVSVGSFVIINSSAVVEHDCNISCFVHISPGANLAGRVSVGERTWLGIGSTIIQNTSIGADVIVGAQALVLEDLVDPGIYY